MDHSRPAPQRPFEPALARDNEARPPDTLSSPGITDSGSQRELDEITRLACAICQTPSALIALTDEGRRRITSRAGVAGMQTPPEEAFCDLAVVGPDVLVIPDVTADPRFAGHPAVVGEPHIRFYAGAPLVTADGLALGALCVIDRRTRQPTTAQIDALRTLSRAVVTLLAKRDLERRLAEVEAAAQSGGVAHDLNNALSPIVSVLDFLARRHMDTRTQEQIAVALASAERMTQMVRRIPGLARGVEDAGGPLQALDLMREMERIARATFPSGIEVQADLPADLWPIAGDSTQVHQVLLNLCVNARDAMAGRGLLSLGAGNVEIDAAFATLFPGAQPGPHVALFVADTGRGIPPDLHEMIFEPFFTTKERGQGTGLGLSTTLGIVRRHGGFIQVWSRVGEGTTFTVYLPAARR